MGKNGERAMSPRSLRATHKRNELHIQPRNLLSVATAQGSLIGEVDESAHILQLCFQNVMKGS